MRQHKFGALPPVSTLTLGGGGLGMLWGATGQLPPDLLARVDASVVVGA